MSANVNRLAACGFVRTAFLALVLALLSSQGHAEEWKTYQFGDASIEAPSGWQITCRQPGHDANSQPARQHR